MRVIPRSELPRVPNYPVYSSFGMGFTPGKGEPYSLTWCERVIASNRLDGRYGWKIFKIGNGFIVRKQKQI